MDVGLARRGTASDMLLRFGMTCAMRHFTSVTGRYSLHVKASQQPSTVDRHPNHSAIKCWGTSRHIMDVRHVNQGLPRYQQPGRHVNYDAAEAVKRYKVVAISPALSFSVGLQDMEQSVGGTERPSFKLIHKLAPTRWGKARHIRSRQQAHVHVDYGMPRVDDTHNALKHHNSSVSGFWHCSQFDLTQYTLAAIAVIRRHRIFPNRCCRNP